MTRGTWTFVAALVVAIPTLLIARFVERLDNSYVIVTRNHVYDFIGPVKNAFNRVTRTCGDVTPIDHASPHWQTISEFLSKQASLSTAMPRQLLQQDGWVLVESEFQSNEPGILLLAPDGTGFKVAAVWSGSAAPFSERNAIRHHLFASEPRAPAALVRCFEPSIQPFSAS